MYLTEEFSKNECEEIFLDMIDEFDYYNEEIDFYSADISKKLDWLASRNRQTLGRCTYMPDGYFHIKLNPNMLRFQDDGLTIIKNVIAHELCHTLPGCMNHGPRFHKYVAKIKQLMGYVIDTKADEDSSGYFNKYLPQSNYMIKCDDCGNEIFKNTMCDPIKNPGRYKCNLCRGDVSSYILNKNTGEYELYRSPQDTLDYKYEIICPDCGWKQSFKTRSAKFHKFIDFLKYDVLCCPQCGEIDVYVKDDNRNFYANWGEIFKRA